MESSYAEQFILANYDCRATSNYGEYRTHCPFCGHKGQKFYFYFSIYAFKCWHCETKGTLRKFFRLLHSGVEGLEYSDKDIEFQEEREKTPIKLPSDFKAFSKFTNTELAGKYVSYLLGRGLSLNTIYGAGLGYLTSKTHYVVFPIRNLLGKQVYYTTILTRRDLDLQKSYNPTLGTDCISKGDVLFNINHVARSNDVWLVEGPIDCLSFTEVRLPAVALLGKTLSDQQARLLKLANFSTINICLDSDALQHSMNVAEKVKSFCRNVNLCILPNGDPNEALQQNRLTEFVGNVIPFNSLTKMKILMDLKNSVKKS